MQYVQVQDLTNKMKTYTGDFRPLYVERVIVHGLTVYVDWQDEDGSSVCVTEHELGDKMKVEVFG